MSSEPRMRIVSSATEGAEFSQPPSTLSIIQPAGRSAQPDHRVRLVIELMQSDLTREWSTEELAAAVQMSASRLRHLFRSETGTTTSLRLRQLRLQRAAELLVTTFDSVKTIMHSVGVNQANYFDQIFRKAYGLSPLAYRKQSEHRSRQLPEKP